MGILFLLLGTVAGCRGSDGPMNPVRPGPTPLAVTCPANIDAALDQGAELAVTYVSPAAAGGQAPVTVTCVPASGSMFGPGASTVTCTAVDSAGQQASCTFGVTVRRIPRLSVTSFMAFGDSVTEGKLSLTFNLLIDSPSHSYPAALTRMLQERYSAQTFRVVNEGYGGERAAESRVRFNAALREHRPEAVLLMHGINDLNGDGLPGVQRASDAVEDLVKDSLAWGARTFVATLPPLGPGFRAFCPQCVPPFNARIRQVAAGKGAVLVDVHQAWGGRTDLMGADGIHPTPAGYEVIASAFFEGVRTVLEAAGAQ